MKIIFIFLFIFLNSVYACPVGQNQISEKSIEISKRVFIGYVTGIHAKELEECFLELAETDPNRCYGYDHTTEHEINVVVTETLKGNTKKIEKVILKGCGIPIPKLYKLSTFYEDENGFYKIRPENKEFFEESYETTNQNH
jgi:hypothetical protein